MADELQVDGWYRDYRIEAELGAGGMSTVFRAFCTNAERPVAIKVLRTDRASPKDAERVLRDARALAKVSHRNLPELYAVERLPTGLPVIIMELLEGQTLGDYLADQEGFRLGVLEALLTALEAAKPLAFLHALGIVHRDLKPDNIFRCRRWPGTKAMIRVLDFGISFHLRLAKLTHPDHMLGTTHYMSPEYLLEQAVDHRSDQYSLGCILYQCLTGALLYVDDLFNPPPLVEVNHAHAVRPPPALAELRAKRAGVPDNVWHIVMRLLSKRPAERYATTDDLIDALAAAAGPLRDQGGGRDADLTGGERAQPSALELAPTDPSAPVLPPATTSRIVAKTEEMAPMLEAAAEPPRSEARWRAPPLPSSPDRAIRRKLLRLAFRFVRTMGAASIRGGLAILAEHWLNRDDPWMRGGAAAAFERYPDRAFAAALTARRAKEEEPLVRELLDRGVERANSIEPATRPPEPQLPEPQPPEPQPPEPQPPEPQPPEPQPPEPEPEQPWTDPRLRGREEELDYVNLVARAHRELAAALGLARVDRATAVAALAHAHPWRRAGAASYFWQHPDAGAVALLEEMLARETDALARRVLTDALRACRYQPAPDATAAAPAGVPRAAAEVPPAEAGVQGVPAARERGPLTRPAKAEMPAFFRTVEDIRDATAREEGLTEEEAGRHLIEHRMADPDPWVRATSAVLAGAVAGRFCVLPRLRLSLATEPHPFVRSLLDVAVKLHAAAPANDVLPRLWGRFPALGRDLGMAADDAALEGVLAEAFAAVAAERGWSHEEEQERLFGEGFDDADPWVRAIAARFARDVEPATPLLGRVRAAAEREAEPLVKALLATTIAAHERSLEPAPGEPAPAAPAPEPSPAPAPKPSPTPVPDGGAAGERHASTMPARAAGSVHDHFLRLGGMGVTALQLKTDDKVTLAVDHGRGKKRWLELSGLGGCLGVLDLTPCASRIGVGDGVLKEPRDPRGKLVPGAWLEIWVEGASAPARFELMDAADLDPADAEASLSRAFRAGQEIVIRLEELASLLEPVKADRPPEDTAAHREPSDRWELFRVLTFRHPDRQIVAEFWVPFLLMLAVAVAAAAAAALLSAGATRRNLSNEPRSAELP